MYENDKKLEEYTCKFFGQMTMQDYVGIQKKIHSHLKKLDEKQKNKKQ